MPEGSSTEIEQTIKETNISHTDLDACIDLLTKPSQSKEEKKLYERKVRYLKELPNNLAQQLQGHIINHLVEKARHLEKYNETLAENGKPIIVNEEIPILRLVSDSLENVRHKYSVDPKSLIKGEILEILAQTQATQEGLRIKNRGLTPEQKSELENKSQRLLSVAQNPDLFGFPELNPVKNPDYAWFQVDDDGNLIVTKIAEVKSGDHLDSRAFSQLSETGFRSTLSALVEKINTLQDASKHGLTGFGVDGQQITIDPDVKQVIIVCKGVKPNTDREFEKFVRPGYFDKNKLTKGQQGEFVELLKNENITEIIESPFTRDEISKLSEYFLRKIMDILEKQQTL